MKKLLVPLLVIFLITSTVSLNVFAAAKEKSKEVTHSWLITVNLDTFTLTIYDNNQLYKSYPVALGRVRTPTPGGQYVILTKAVNPAWGGNGHPELAKKGGDPKNPLGPRWIGTSAGKNPGYSVGIHGNTNPKSIGTRASGGCIRMYNNDVIAIYQLIPLKTPVWIGSTKKLNEWGIK